VKQPLFFLVLQTMKFGILLAVRSFKSGGRKSRFSFREVPALERLGYDVGRDDVLQNHVSRGTQLMNASRPWRGPREKSVPLLQMLIEATTDPGSVVLDCTTSTGKLQSSTL
jgi:hypothetical protein